MNPSFEVVGGDDASPVVLHVPHSSTEIPADVRARILLDDDALRAELEAMTDAATDHIASMATASAAVRPWSFVNRLSRLVIDPERFTEPGLERMDAVGMGAVYTATSQRGVLRHGDPVHRDDLLRRYFHPYAESLADLVDARLAACGRAVVIDVHSYPAMTLPYEIHPDAARPPVCLGIDTDHTPDWLLAAAEGAFVEWGTAVDEPFVGTYVPTRHFGRDQRVTSLMVEIRRDQYLDADGVVVGERLVALAEAVARLVDAATRAG